MQQNMLTFITNLRPFDYIQWMILIATHFNVVKIAWGTAGVWKKQIYVKQLNHEQARYILESVQY